MSDDSGQPMRGHNASVTRLRTRHEQHLEKFIGELGTTLEPSGIYFGVWCASCKCDVIPMTSGRCGWCDRRLPRAA